VTTDARAAARLAVGKAADEILLLMARNALTEICAGDEHDGAGATGRFTRNATQLEEARSRLIASLG
jgi:hypothetical protein